ncbi:hypothetical protein [Flavobacterium sp. PL02]|uniref:hypothetical protein n=1 Tax=Flavobacterium sp. PL02 TaxID=3088354 RepID=UPI002B22C36E|nr:hypothetical protein [Flavobacterium sp. PL02]MEA9411857.1 hypothetical protein [Flavobacterium sp. PL02]
MKKLIKNLMFFLLPILLVLSLIECFYRLVPNNYTLKNTNIQKIYDTTEVLILGNSHTFYGLNPSFFDKQTFNLSNISQTLYFDQLLFEKHINKFKKLKYVILNIEYTSLSQLKDTEEDSWRKYYYKSYMDLNVPIISKFDYGNYFLSSTRPFNKNIKLVNSYFIEGTVIDCDVNGFGINYTKEKRFLNIDKIAPNTIRKHEDNLFDFSENISRIESIIRQCKEKEIEVILVTMPVSKAYSVRVNKFKLDKIVKTAKLFENKNSNVRYLNLFNDFKFTNNDFYDPDHLHTEGAEKCSLIVSTFLDNN